MGVLSRNGRSEGIRKCGYGREKMIRGEEMDFRWKCPVSVRGGLFFRELDADYPTSIGGEMALHYELEQDAES